MKVYIQPVEGFGKTATTVSLMANYPLDSTHVKINYVVHDEDGNPLQIGPGYIELSSEQIATWGIDDDPIIAAVLADPVLNFTRIDPPTDPES